MKTFIVIQQRLWCNDSGHGIHYSSDLEEFDARNKAVSHGFDITESDDFNIGVVEGGRLISFDWMDKPIGETQETIREIAEAIGLGYFDHDAALDFDLFAGDFGDSGDVELSNKIVTGRGEYTCFICYGKIVKGEVHRSAVHKFDGEIMSYRVCNECCRAMASSVNYDFMSDDEGVEDEQDPIDARYALGRERRESKGEVQS
nr:MAG TPA: hypothetical protein [Caudoviricetes sp.]